MIDNQSLEKLIEKVLSMENEHTMIDYQYIVASMKVARACKDMLQNLAHMTVQGTNSGLLEAYAKLAMESAESAAR